MYVFFSKTTNKIDKIFLPRPRNHSGTVEFMLLVFLDVFLYVRAFFHEDDRPAVYPYGDAAVIVNILFFMFHL